MFSKNGPEVAWAAPRLGGLRAGMLGVSWFVQHGAALRGEKWEASGRNPQGQAQELWP